jgi:hypothetical protein
MLRQVQPIESWERKVNLEMTGKLTDCGTSRAAVKQGGLLAAAPAFYFDSSMPSDEISVIPGKGMGVSVSMLNVFA